MSKTLTALTAGALLCASSFANAHLPGSISGLFFNPEQNGHGLNISILNDRSAVATWHVFDNAGDPLTLYIEAIIEGRRIVGQAYAPNGMRFGSFDAADLQAPHWGQVEIDFSDCDHATLSWDADDADYGNGDMPIRRLVPLKDIQCHLPPRNDLAPGLYEASLPNPIGWDTILQGVVDEQGTFWGLYRRYVDGFPAGEVPRDGWYHDRAPSSLVITPFRVDADGKIDATAYAKRLSWLNAPASNWQSSSSRFHWERQDSSAPESYVGIMDSQSTVAVQQGSSRANQIRPVHMEGVAGTYAMPVLNEFHFPQDIFMNVATDGSVCIHGSADSPCSFAGRLLPSNEALGLLDFEISPTGTWSNNLPDDLPPFSGTGWLAETPYGTELVLVGGPTTEAGFGFVGVKQSN